MTTAADARALAARLARALNGTHLDVLLDNAFGPVTDPATDDEAATLLVLAVGSAFADEFTRPGPHGPVVAWEQVLAMYGALSSGEKALIDLAQQVRGGGHFGDRPTTIREAFGALDNADRWIAARIITRWLLGMAPPPITIDEL